MTFSKYILFCAFTVCLPFTAAAQGAQVAFGNTEQNSSLPVEVTADNLNVNQENGTAIFTGNVLIGQGEMRLSAPRVLVVYKQDQSGIEELQATGGVTLVSGPDCRRGPTGGLQYRHRFY